MRQRHQILADVIRIVGTRYLTRALQTVKTLVVARVLGPLDFGVIAVVARVPLYGQWVDLGLMGGLMVHLPTLSDEANKEEHEAFNVAAFSVTALTSSLACLGVVLATLGLVEETSLKICLLLAACIVPAQAAFSFFQNHHRIRQEFTVIANSTAVQELSALVLTLVLVLTLGVEGFFGALLLSYGLACVYQIGPYRRSGGVLRFRLDMKRSLLLLRLGLPLCVITILHTLFVSVDALVMTRFLRMEEVGLYAIAQQVVAVIQFVPMSVGFTLFPVFREEQAKNVDKVTCRRHFLLVSESLSYAMAYVIAGAVLFLPIIPVLLPKYSGSLEATRVLAYLTFFLGAENVARNQLTAAENLWKPCLILKAVTTALAPIAVLLALVLNTGLIGVAMAMGGAYAVAGVGSHLLMLYLTDTPKREVVVATFYSLLPFVLLVGTVETIRAILSAVSLTGIPSIVGGLLLFVPLSLPLFALMLYRTPLKDTLRSAWQARRRS